MNTTRPFKPTRLSAVVSFATLWTLPLTLCLGQIDTSGPPYSVIERGPFYRILQRTLSVTNSVTGEVSAQVQSYTELEDGMHYLSNGQWVEAQDLIELTADGAVATHGQMKASFKSDITSPAAISLMTAAGELFQSHPVGLFYADRASGKLARIAAVQPCEAILYPPNVIVFSNILSGLRADLMLVWTKGGYEQNLVLKQAPPPPASLGLSSSSATLQFWSAIDSWPAPQEQRTVRLDSGLEDHILIFGSAWFPVGAAFAIGDASLPPTGQAARIRLVRPSEPGTIPVAKTLVKIADQQVLVEEVRYLDLAPALSQLPQASLTPKPERTVELAERGTFLRQAPEPSPASRPFVVASVQYRPKGVVLDYSELSGNASSKIFANGETYHIQNSYSVGPGTATFEPNACIKLDHNAWLLVYAGVSCSSSGSPTILTSKDDNLFGAPIIGSSGNPAYSAAEGLWMYYQAVQTTLQNLRVRWSQIGIRYDAQYLNQPHLTSCSFEHCDTGVRLSIGGDNFYLSQATYCDVPTPLIDASDGATHIFGGVTLNCGDLPFPYDHVQHESTVTINPSDPSKVAIFAASYSGYPQFQYGILKVTSSDGGSTWSPPALGNVPTPKEDVQAAYDATGNLFLCYTIPDNSAIKLLKSRDNGGTWTVVGTFSGSTSNVDRPVLATGPGGGDYLASVWILYTVNNVPNAAGYLTLAGAPVTNAAGTLGTFVTYTFATSAVGVPPPVGTGLAVGPSGQVLMAYESRNEPTTTDRKIYVNLDSDGVGSSQPAATYTAQFQVNMQYGHPILAQRDRGVVRLPVLAWDRNSNTKYLAFADTHPATPDNQDTDIYVMWSTNANASNWSDRIRVNDDSTTSSQFLPGIAVDQTSGRVAIAWYDCRNDTQNISTQFFAAVSTDRFATPQPRNFQLNLNFSDSHPQSCTDSWTINYGDYTGLAFHAGYLIPSWCSFAQTADSCGDIHTCRVAW